MEAAYPGGKSLEQNASSFLISLDFQPYLSYIWITRRAHMAARFGTVSTWLAACWSFCARTTPILVGVLFVVTATAKILHMPLFLKAIDEGGIVPVSIRGFMGLLPVGEYVLAAGLFMKKTRDLSLLLSGGFLGCAAAYAGCRIVRGNVGDCPCIPAVVTLPPYAELGLSLVLLAACTAALALPQRGSARRFAG